MELWDSDAVFITQNLDVGGGRGERNGRESLRGKGGEGKRGEEGKFRGARPPQIFFLEPRLPVDKRSLRWEGFVEKVGFEPGVKE